MTWEQLQLQQGYWLLVSVPVEHFKYYKKISLICAIKGEYQPFHVNLEDRLKRKIKSLAVLVVFKLRKLFPLFTHFLKSW